ncbi:MAG: hypothetical protein V4563_08250 [Pseudomonadota bacterium]
MNDGRMVIATFCDDIRYERGNKHSLMGCYSGELIIDRIPAILPKLCVQIQVVTPLEQPFILLTLRACLDDEVLGETVLPGDQLLALHQEVLARSHADSTLMGIHSHMVFAPFVVNQPCTLRVEAETEYGIIKGSRLQIRLRTPDDELS